MHQLRLVFARADKIMVLIAAAILPFTGSCGGKTDDSSTLFVAGGSNCGGAGGSLSELAADAAGGGPGECRTYCSAQTYVVPLPSGETASSLAARCNWPGTFASDRPLDRVTLNYDSNSPAHATGITLIDPALMSVSEGGIGLASIVSDAGTITGLTFVDNTSYAFDVQISAAPHLGTSLSFEITLDYDCSPISAASRTVQTTTTVVLCGSYGEINWVSSGDTCTTCY